MTAASNLRELFDGWTAERQSSPAFSAFALLESSEIIRVPASLHYLSTYLIPSSFSRPRFAQAFAHLIFYFAPRTISRSIINFKQPPCIRLINDGSATESFSYPWHGSDKTITWKQAVNVNGENTCHVKHCIPPRAVCASRSCVNSINNDGVRNLPLLDACFHAIDISIYNCTKTEAQPVFLFGSPHRPKNSAGRGWPARYIVSKLLCYGSTYATAAISMIRDTRAYFAEIVRIPISRY